MDAALILWQKCKQVLGKLPSSSKKDFGSALLKTGDPDRVSAEIKQSLF